MQKVFDMRLGLKKLLKSIFIQNDDIEKKSSFLNLYFTN